MVRNLISSSILLQAIILCNLQKHLQTKLAKMAKHLILGPILVRLVQIWAPKFLVSFTCIKCQKFSQAIIVQKFKFWAIIVHKFQFQAIIVRKFRKLLMIQASVNSQTPHFGVDLSPLDPNFCCQFCSCGFCCFCCFCFFWQKSGILSY